MNYRALNIDNHCFFGSVGGVSTGKYSSLNINLLSQDNNENVKKNINIIANNFKLNLENVFIPIQTHSTDVVFIDKPSFREIKCDGCITNNKDILLFALTADCIPVLLRDDVAGLVGAVHCGWKGSFNGIIDNAIDLMIKYGSSAENIKIALGPHIQKKSFEVKQDFYDMFMGQNQNNNKYFFNINNSLYMDLSLYLVGRIKQKKVNNISVCDIDTYTNLNYFSYRRCKHLDLIEKERDFPVQASVIRL